MSNSAASAEQAERIAFQSLERAVGQALSRLEALRLRAEASENRSRELEELLARFTEDEGSAALMLTRLRALEEENQDMRERLQKGREGVERLLARIRFLEGQR